MSRIANLLLDLFKGVSHFELVILISMILILITFHATFDYLKSVILCFQLKGPPARFLLGNALILIDKNSESKIIHRKWSHLVEIAFGTFHLKSNDTILSFFFLMVNAQCWKSISRQLSARMVEFFAYGRRFSHTLSLHIPMMYTPSCLHGNTPRKSTPTNCCTISWEMDWSQVLVNTLSSTIV